MIVNMACPKCGGQATEYDEKKWSCLKCGNKFVYAPVQPSHTFVQSNVHIQGQATFELDVQNSKPSVPKMAKMFEHDPDRFGKSIAENNRGIVEINRRLSSYKTKKLIALIFTVLMGAFIAVVILGTLIGPSDENGNADSGGAVGSFVILGLLMIWPASAFYIYRKKIFQDKSLIQKLQQTISSLEQQNVMDTKIGDYVICPHCETTLNYVALNSPLPVEELKHCLKCGKQFFTSGLNSYPILFKK
jgi:hypothetical protein